MKKSVKVLVFFSFFIAFTIQASEPQSKRFNPGGFLSGLGTGLAIPIFGIGCMIHEHEKKMILRARYPEDLIDLKKSIFKGRHVMGGAASFILVSLLVNNRHLLMKEKV